MKGQRERHQPRQTLKQYLASNSLRKKAMSKGHSREDSYGKNSTLQNHHKGSSTARQNVQVSRRQLIQQIKIKMAQLISSDNQLNALLRLFDKLIALYNNELSQHQKQNQRMMSMMKQSVVLEVQSPTVRSRDSKFGKQSIVDFQNVDIFENGCSDLSGTHHAMAKQTPHHRRVESHDSQIPNINLLMVTQSNQGKKTRPLIQSQQTYQQTKQTQQNVQHDIRKSSNEFIGDTFRNVNQSAIQVRSRKGSAMNNASNFLDPGLFGKDQDPSQIRISLRSSLWNNMNLRGTQNRLLESQFRLKSQAPLC